MNKEEFYKKAILEGPIEDPYAYAVSLLPPSRREEYESAHDDYSRHFQRLFDEIKRSENEELMHIFMEYEPTANTYYTMLCAAMFLYGAAIMEDECIHAIGNLVLVCAKEMSSA